MPIRPGYQNLCLVYDVLRSELDELLTSLRIVFQKEARDKVRYPEMHTRQIMNDQMLLISSAGRRLGGGGGWRSRVGFVCFRLPNVHPVFGRVCNRIDTPF